MRVGSDLMMYERQSCRLDSCRRTSFSLTLARSCTSNASSRSFTICKSNSCSSRSPYSASNDKRICTRRGAEGEERAHGEGRRLRQSQVEGSDRDRDVMRGMREGVAYIDVF